MGANELKVLIVGAGKLGIRLAKTMNFENFDVTLMDTNPRVIDMVNEHLDVMTLVASGVNITALKDLGIGKFDLLVATTDSDATNAIICSMARKLGCRQTVARVRDPEYMEHLDFIRSELGIDLIVNPDLATAVTISKYLMQDVVHFSGEFASGKVKMIDLNIGTLEVFVGKTIAQLEGLEHLLIAAISRDSELIIPHGSTELKPGDVIFLLGEMENIEKFCKTYKLKARAKKVENAMILGGGNVGFYLARELSSARVRVTLIEQDRKKAQKLVERLEHVLVIHGDGSDITLLRDENLEQMEAFVGVTGFDEQNLLLALMAKQYGVEKSVAKVSRQNFTKIINKMDIDAAVNPVNITASHILKFVRGDRVASVSLLLGGRGEVIEVIARDSMPYIGKPLHKLQLPQGILVGAIVRGNQVIIPKGSSQIMAGDRIILFAHEDDIQELKTLFISGRGGLFGELWNRSKNIGVYSDR